MAATLEQKRLDQLLRLIAEGTAGVTGDDFLHSLVRHLAEALGVRYAFVAEFADVKTRVCTLAFWAGDHYLENFEYDLEGTPCEAVLAGDICLYKEHVQDLFPTHREELAAISAESYLAIPLVDKRGEVMGHLGLIDVKPMTGSVTDLSVMRIFAARARAELERFRAEEQVRRSEERLASVLASAMDAIITIDENRRITLFNDAAERIFGCARSWATGQVFDRFLSKPFRNLLDGYLHDAGDRQSQFWAPEGLTALRANREEFPIEATFSPMLLGGKRYHTFILRDVNERRKTEAELARLQVENRFLRAEIRAAQSFEDMIGESQPMREVFSLLEQVAGTDSTVLVMGETGTGKERIAQAIHNLSPRSERLLVKMNCAALPSELIESELFGHEKGAFTGATAQRKGRFELADGGTLFLDEVGELSLSAQAKLLRVLQEQEFERVGGGRPIRVDVRVIAATNRNLAESVKNGEFRSDLYYRLNVFPVRVPPLRERQEDIPVLARHFLAKFARKLGKTLSDISPQSIRRLQRYPWPGNVRELQNLVERAAILARGSVVDVEPDSAEPGTDAPVGDAGPALRLDDVERDHLVKILEQAGWIIEGKAGAAALLGLTPSTLRYRMQKLRIVRPSLASRD
ncbi:sigma 54-interacting transcriptional regulator [Methylococcus sp. EFPC2]|uniref:sigma 54-interacting transcriptional regulator n=1 Tax=Methylococcus sp. EFPC2 TaxID=2812648 RepID=UPI0019687F5F|nr:sigma 54-interacting transcriptional regulator [Methylococcus sp. EFPC2]QSA95784.1 sigma 54-interacting transcriptional regulator [Methylococcus sp. EFPC2]